MMHSPASGVGLGLGLGWVRVRVVRAAPMMHAREQREALQSQGRRGVGGA